MKVHPAAECFPLLDDASFLELKKSIADVGQKLPCTVWQRDGEEILIDGRNRHRACEELGIETQTEPFYGAEKDALDLIIALNLKRRHLTDAQRAVIAAAMVPLYAEAARASKAHGKTAPGRTLTPKPAQASRPDRNARSAVGQAAAAMGVTRYAVEKARATTAAEPGPGPKRRILSAYDKARKAVFALTNKEWRRLRRARDNEDQA